MVVVSSCKVVGWREFVRFRCFPSIEIIYVGWPPDLFAAFNAGVFITEDITDIDCSVVMPAYVSAGDAGLLILFGICITCSS